MSIFFDRFLEENCLCETESLSCNLAIDTLKASMDDEQKKLLRNLIDEKDLLIAQVARDNYTKGLHDGMELVTAVYAQQQDG